ncbi:hypothetical protein PAXINDRAFT_99503 [Paxillus involutus ATCC 200175]|uniref:MIF4G domain-containing protein n=1 Tax=Paxillus involutus ATCC 200175 TaxID=664439 RepID=A0A0C9SZU8_PAXIN|nr:hypothetical protein PAXINDRAFT_99503 [Paxillus involutus ATCC 200175]
MFSCVTSASTTPVTTAATTSTTVKPALGKVDIAKLFKGSSSTYSPSSSDTSSPSTPHHQPSQLGAHQYTPFVPGMRHQQGASGPRSPAFSRPVPNGAGAPSQPMGGPGGPGGPPIPASPRLAPHHLHQHPHQPPAGVPPQQVPMQPMHWSPYYYPVDPYGQPASPWFYPAHAMHQQPHPPHTPHPPSASPQGPPHPGIAMSPRNPPPTLPPGTPTMTHAVPHTPHTPQPPPQHSHQPSGSISVSSPPPTPSTATGPGLRSLNTNASAFVPTNRPPKAIVIKNEDGTEVNLESLKKHSPQPPTVRVSPGSPAVTGPQTTSVKIDSKTAKRKRKREEKARLEQEKKEAAERAEREEQERKRKSPVATSRRTASVRIESEEAKQKRDNSGGSGHCQASGTMIPSMDPQSSVGPGVTTGGFWGKAGISSSPFATLEPVAPLKAPANRWVPASTTRRPIAADANSPELVDHKVRSLLDELTTEKFDSISDQIIAWANESENENDGRTLIQVVGLVFEKATDDAARSEMYARLCRKMMVMISPEVQNDGIKNAKGMPIIGGHLFRKYLLARCHEDFKRGWFAKETTEAAAAANEKRGEESLYSDEYCAAQKAKRRGLGLIKFIGELFKFQMLTERSMHECVKKLLINVENPGEEEIEGLCQLLKTVGQQLDVPKARIDMDMYFARMKELRKDLNVSPRMQFMLQDMIELRERRWVGRGCVSTPTTIAAIHEAAAKNKAAAEAQIYQRQLAKLSAALVPKMDLRTFCDHYNLSLAILQKLDSMEITGPHGLRFVSNTDLREIGKLHIGELADVRDAEERWSLGQGVDAVPVLRNNY